MQNQHIPSAKIIGVEKHQDQKTLKYTFFDTQTGIKDAFYSYQKINYIDDLPGYLWLNLDDNQQDKFFLYFSQIHHKRNFKESITNKSKINDRFNNQL